MVGLAHGSMHRVVMDHLDDITNVEIRSAAQRAPRGPIRGRNRDEVDAEEEDIRHGHRRS